MLCYKDKTFCSDNIKNHTCNRELTEEDRANAEKLGLPVAYGSFCVKDLSGTSNS
jgi:hypothetical protein